MIQLANDTFVDADAVKEVKVIKELSSVKITYEVRQLCEKTIVCDDSRHAEAFKQFLLRDIANEQREKASLEGRIEFALRLLLLLEEHYFLEEK